MQDEQQYNQLMLLYQQLKNGAEDIAGMIDSDDYDSAISMLKNREQLYISCKCIRNYLELTPVQTQEVDKIVDEIRELELKNIKKLEKGMEEVQMELAKMQRTQKLQQAYESDIDSAGSIVNVQE